MINKDIVILLPSLNEEESIGNVIEEIQDNVKRGRIIVIDNSSTDQTAFIARSKGMRVINVKERGKGIAIRKVLPRLLEQYNEADFIMIDSDFTYPAKHINELIEKLDGNDVVVGYRKNIEPEAMTTTNKIGNKIISATASVLYLRLIKDVCSGMWGFKHHALEKFNLTSDKFTLEADIFVNIVKNKLTLAQIPIDYRARLKDSNTKLKIIDGIKIEWFLVRNRF